MANYYVFSIQQMIDIANGGNGLGGEPIQGIPGFAPGKGTYLAPGDGIQGEAQALSYLINNGLALQYISGFGPMREFYFTGS